MGRRDDDDDVPGAGCQCQEESLGVGWALTPQMGLQESLGCRDIPTQSRAFVDTRVQG